jgi:hypothetical protein
MAIPPFPLNSDLAVRLRDRAGLPHSEGLRAGIQTNWTLAACLAVFIGGAALAEDAATGIIKPLLSVKFSRDRGNADVSVEVVRSGKAAA